MWLDWWLENPQPIQRSAPKDVPKRSLDTVAAECLPQCSYLFWKKNVRMCKHVFALRLRSTFIWFSKLWFRLVPSQGVDLKMPCEESPDLDFSRYQHTHGPWHQKPHSPTPRVSPQVWEKPPSLLLEPSFLAAPLITCLGISLRFLWFPRRWCLHQWCKLLYNPNPLITNKNRREISAMRTNLANKLRHHLVAI